MLLLQSHFNSTLQHCKRKEYENKAVRKAKFGLTLLEAETEESKGSGCGIEGSDELEW
jgi:hypothetical protein